MLGFIGVGSMGYPIAKRILNAGIPLSFFARRDEVISKVKDVGGNFCSSIEELGYLCNKVILFVNTSEQCEECIKKLLVGMRTGGTIIIGSTILPEDSIKLTELCSSKNLTLLDAPVSGGVKGAEEGTLTIMISGDKKCAEECQEIFECYGRKIVYVGKNSGDAQVLKAINQHLVGINMAAVCEAYALGKACGIDLEVIFDTITSCAGNSRIFENRSRFIIDRNFDKRSSLQIHHKDLGICRHIAEDIGMKLPVAGICEELYEQAMKFYDPNEDGIAIIKLLEQKGI